MTELNVAASPSPADQIVQGEELKEWIQLASMDLRPRLAHRFLEQFGSPAALIAAPEAQVRQVEGVNDDVMDRITSARQCPTLPAWLEYGKRMGISVVPFSSGWYPPLLREIPDPPAALFVRGQTEVLRQTSIAIVGTRSATRYGLRMAETLGHDLAAAGLCVVSGGAVGADAAAHRGASSTGVTLVVLGCGLDVGYPASNQALFRDVCKKGAVVTEFGIGARPDQWRFPARNRIISGICSAVIIVEAGEKSGALVTCGFALEQGREVMAVPGEATSTRSRGCHALIRDGATLVENAGQVLEAMGFAAAAAANAPEPAGAPPPDLPLDQGAILLALAQGQLHLDELTGQCGLSASQASAAVTLLELRGLVRRSPGSFFERV